MYSKWTDHLHEDKDKQDFRRQVISAKDVLARQKQILDGWLESLSRSELDPSQFDSPNWANKQAYKNGLRQGMNQLKILIDLDQQETNVDRHDPSQ